MLKFIKIVSFSLLFVCLPAQAEWSKQYDFAYTMGDGDTKGSARQAAIEQIKLKASGEAGTYVDATTTLKEDGSLTESVQMIGASMVKVTVTSEALSVSKEGQGVLNLVAVATIDDTELSKRINILRQDKEKARQLKVLQAENSVLREGLKQIRASLLARANTADVASLLAKQDQTIRKINENNESITQVFTKGTLLQIAARNTDALENAKADLNENLYHQILRTPIRAEVETVEESGSGYTAVIRVGWSFDLKNAAAELGKHLALSKYEDPRKKNGLHKFAIHHYDNTDGNGPDALSGRLFNHIVSNPIYAKIKIGDSERKIPVLYGGGDTWSQCGGFARRNSYGDIKANDICVANMVFSGNEVPGWKNSPNPIRISLTKEEAENATNVQAEMFVYSAEHEKEEERMRMIKYRLQQPVSRW